MPIVPQETEKRRTYYRCRLGRSRLDRLFAMAAEGTAGNYVVSTQYGSTRYRAGTLAELVTLVEAGHTPGEWTNLTVDLVDPQHERNISVALGLREIELRFYGADTTWVYGQDARLRELLTSYDGTLDPNTGRAEVSAYLTLSIGFLVFTAAAGTGVLSQTMSITTEGLGTVTAVAGLMWVFSWIKERATAHKWSVAAEVTSGSPLTRYSAGSWLTGFATVAGIFAAIATVAGR